MDYILPFYGLKFFLVSLLTIIAILWLKGLLQRIISYEHLIGLLTISYLLLFLPNKLYIIGFLLYTYFIYYYFTEFKPIAHLLKPLLLIALPLILFKLDVRPFYNILGISYITFRSIQMMVDYKNYGRLNFINFTSFLLFPPTLLAGPIDRSYRFKEDLETGYRNIHADNFWIGWRILLMGILLKFVIADFIDLFWLSKLDTKSQYIVDMVNNAYAYTIFLYFDFAGYSLMAIGLAKMIGINIPINFDKPYLAENPQMFWRRFHITLGAWLTDYFFKPIYKYLHQFSGLQGHRLLTQNLALIATFLLMGMWNGLAFHYLFSGFLFGVYSAIHNSYVHYIRQGGRDFFALFPDTIAVTLKRLMMLNFAVFALYFFSGRVPL